MFKINYDKRNFRRSLLILVFVEIIQIIALGAGFYISESIEALLVLLLAPFMMRFSVITAIVVAVFLKIFQNKDFDTKIQDKNILHIAGAIVIFSFVAFALAGAIFFQP